MPKDDAYLLAEQKIAEALTSRATELAETPTNGLLRETDKRIQTPPSAYPLPIRWSLSPQR